MTNIVDFTPIIACGCNSQNWELFECMECNYTLSQCACLWNAQAGQTEIEVFCSTCSASFPVDLDEMMFCFDPDYFGELLDDKERVDDDPVTEKLKGATYTTVICRHYNVPIEFPDGTTIYASSEHNREPDEEAPDYGLYLDGSWEADCVAGTIGWIDYGLPVRWDVAAYMMVDAYKKAQAGAWVEVGCLGGHGRTGTALACLGVLGGFTAEQAIEHVRTTYCEKAIETEEQEWFVDWFHKFIFGGETLPKPASRYSHDEDEGTVFFWDEDPWDWTTYDSTNAWRGKPDEVQPETIRTQKTYPVKVPDKNPPTTVELQDEQKRLWEEAQESQPKQLVPAV